MSKLDTLLNEASGELSRMAHRGMTQEAHASKWHAIERVRFAAQHDGDADAMAEHRMEEMMLGNWDSENGHTY